MREERRAEAEVLLQDLAADVNARAGVMPEFMVREGRIGDEILGAVDDDPLIDVLCVGSNPAEGRGRLVSFLAGHLAGRLTIPLVVVPRHADGREDRQHHLTVRRRVGRSMRSRPRARSGRAAGPGPPAPSRNATPVSPPPAWPERHA